MNTEHDTTEHDSIFPKKKEDAIDTESPISMESLLYTGLPKDYFKVEAGNH